MANLQHFSSILYKFLGFKWLQFSHNIFHFCKLIIYNYVWLQQLMNNTVYGKQMENVKLRCDVKLVRSLPSFDKYHYYETRTIIEKYLVLLYRLERKILLNKPVYGGFVVLELSKLLMYRFNYNFLKTKYGASVRLLDTDTDLLIIYVISNIVYKLYIF